MSNPDHPQKFSGYPAGSSKATAIPNLFFSAQLPAIEDLAELKLTLNVFYRVQQKKGYPRYVTFKELVADSLRLGLIAQNDEQCQNEVRGILRKAVDRGALLQLTVRFADSSEDIYFVNSAQSQKAVTLLRQGELSIGQSLVERPTAVAPPNRGNIFTLYEENIGVLTPLIAEHLSEAEQLYPNDWIKDAIELSVEYNKRNWRYIQAILERWAFEGKSGKGKRR